jgi:hypothetical protein
VYVAGQPPDRHADAYADGEGQRCAARAILIPAEDATGMPDRIADRFRTAIATGALATLLKAINKAPWANPAWPQDKAQRVQATLSPPRARACGRPTPMCARACAASSTEAPMTGQDVDDLL